MRCYVSVLCALSVLAALSHAAPFGLQSSNEQGSAGVATAFNTTALVTTLNQKVQLLRRFCPQLFQVIDTVVQNITSQVFSVVGRVILRNGLGGSTGGDNGDGGESRVSVVLPTFPPDEDEDYEDENEETGNGMLNTASRNSDINEDVDVRRIDSRTTTAASNEIALSANDVEADGAPFTDALNSIENRNTFVDSATNADYTSMTTNGNENVVDATTSSSDNDNSALDEISSNSVNAIFKSLIEVENSEDFKAETTTTMNSGAELSTDENTENSSTETRASRFDIKVTHNGNLINTIPLIQGNVNESENLIKKRSPSSDMGRSRRVIREAETDQDASASGGNGPDPADLSDIEAEDSERDKRYLPFSGDAHVSAGGGSGNFLFDIIRRTADGAARAAGTVYRMVAGTESLGIGLSATSTATRLADASAFSQLIAGSGATEESDEKDNGAGLGGVAEIDVAKSADGYTEGIPGPITRLFVIANRGLANLVQDLILRLAQTSERIVNFKARLITALI